MTAARRPVSPTISDPRRNPFWRAMIARALDAAWLHRGSPVTRPTAPTPAYGANSRPAVSAMYRPSPVTGARTATGSYRADELATRIPLHQLVTRAGRRRSIEENLPTPTVSIQNTPTWRCLVEYAFHRGRPRPADSTLRPTLVTFDEYRARSSSTPRGVWDRQAFPPVPRHRLWTAENNTRHVLIENFQRDSATIVAEHRVQGVKRNALATPR